MGLRLRTVSRLVLACRAIGALMLSAIVALFVAAVLTPLPSSLREDTPYGASVRFLDRHGELLREVRADDDKARAVWVPLDEVGETTALAILAAEDKRFYEHAGVDPSAVVRALVTSASARRVVSGASTLTMQLARIASPHPRTFRGKLGEMAMAVRIEMSLGKREILEQYLNRAPFADGVRGIGAASRWFFDKPPRELSVAEAATLASLPRGPHYYSLTKRPERVLARRDRVLDRMLAAKMIDRETHARAKAEPLTLNLQRGSFGAPHLVDALLSEIRSKAPVPEARPSTVETTIDRALQREAERSAIDVLVPLAKRNVSAASVLVVDNETGAVLAYVGAPRWDDDAHGGKNDGVRARRQPGSTLKPFVYGLAMEDLGFTPATMLPDVELHVPTPAGTYSPRNYDERFHGPVRLREALANSYNVPAVYAATQVGIPRVLDRLHELGFGTLTESAEYYGPALALGDGEVRLWDLVAAYATIARGGVYRPLSATRTGKAPEERRVMPEATAALLADILRDRSSRVAAFGEHSALDLPFEVAAKTGTSKAYRDNWTVGFTHEITVGVWVGNFDGSSMFEVSGIAGAAPLFRAVMAAAMRGLEAKPAAVPASLEHVHVCALSGGTPGRGCTHAIDELVPKGRPLASCGMHETVKIDIRNGLRATPACPSRFVADRSFEIYDGPFASWARAAGRELAPVATSPLCGPAGARGLRSGSPDAIAIRYPRDGARFLIDPSRPQSAQSIPVKVDAPAASEIAVFVDGRLAGRVPGGTPVYWSLAPGAHAIVAESDGARDTVAIVVE